MQRLSGEADLFIEGVCVGHVKLRSGDSAWTFGDFEPNDAFSRFAIPFGEWAMLMHEDETAKLHEEAANELRRIEGALDRLHAEIRLLGSGERQRIWRLNIDGKSIEWTPVGA